MIRPPTVLALAVLGLLLAGCAHPRSRGAPRPAPVAPPVGTVVEGVASWYGPGFHGRRTASGEVYDQDGLTAAHYDWAFGTRVEVTLLSTGRSVLVRVNDRFPPFKGRLIDLSRGAARRIGLVGPGIGQVRVEVVESPGGS